MKVCELKVNLEESQLKLKKVEQYKKQMKEEHARQIEELKKKSERREEVMNQV